MTKMTKTCLLACSAQTFVIKDVPQFFHFFYFLLTWDSIHPFSSWAVIPRPPKLFWGYTEVFSSQPRDRIFPLCTECALRPPPPRNTSPGRCTEGIVTKCPNNLTSTLMTEAEGWSMDWQVKQPLGHLAHLSLHHNISVQLPHPHQKMLTWSTCQSLAPF